MHKVNDVVTLNKKCEEFFKCNEIQSDITGVIIEIKPTQLKIRLKSGLEMCVYEHELKTYVSRFIYPLYFTDSIGRIVEFTDINVAKIILGHTGDRNAYVGHTANNWASHTDETIWKELSRSVVEQLKLV